MSAHPNHPFIGLVVSELKGIHEQLAYSPGSALTEMIKLLHVCDPRAKEKEEWGNLFTDLKDAIQTRMELKGDFPMDVVNKQDAYDTIMLGSYLDYYGRLWHIMWANGYMDEKRFTGFWDPSMGKKSGERFKR